MSLDMDVLRAKLDRFKNQGERRNSFWRPTKDSTVIRIVPWAERPENPFIEMYFHYLAGQTYLSPKSYGKPDPIAEFADHVRGDGDTESWKQAKPFYPKLRTFVPVIVRGEEDQGVRYWSFGKTVFKSLLGILDDEDYGDITDPDEGRDITVEYIPQEKSDTNFAKTTVRPRGKPTTLSDDKEQVEQWLKDQPNFRSLFKEWTYEELQSVLKRYLDPEAEPVDASVASEVLTPDLGESKDEAESEEPKATSKKTKKARKSDDVVKDFDEMFADND